MSDRTTHTRQTLVSRRRAVNLLLMATGATLIGACGTPAAPVSQGATSGPASQAATAAPATPTAASANQAAPTAAATQAVAVTPAATSAPGSQVAPATPAPKTGGVLRVGNVGDVANIDGHSWGPNNGFSIFMIYDSLTTYDTNLKPQPELAESWDVSSDSTQITLHIRQGVQFHSGRELTSEDVVYNLQRPLNPQLQATIASFTILPGFVPPGTTFDAPDKFTVVVKTEKPWVAAFDYFQVLNIMEKATAEGPDSKNKAVGTGPFAFAEWAQGEHLRFEKNKNYWRSGRPYLDGVLINIRSDAQTMVTELEAGVVDMIRAPLWLDFARLKQDSRFTTIKTQTPGTFHQFQPNVTFKPLDNKLVRQALSHAIDRERVVDSVMLGETTPESLPWLASSPAYEAAKQNHFTFDLDKSKALLDQSGVGSLTLDFTYAMTDPAYPQMAQIFQADLAKIGVTLNLKPVQIVQLLDTIQHQTYNGLYTLNDPWASMEPITLFTSSSSAGYRKNNAGYQNDQYTELVSAVSTEPDPAKRKQMYSELNDFLLDQAFHMPVTQSPGRIVTSARVQGIEHRQMDRFMLTNAYFA